jgi:UDP-N-acetylmuramoyl-L-alanine---L-glutamate ligase
VPGSDLDRIDAAGRIAVYGTGREGQAALAWLRHRRPHVTLEVLVDDDTAPSIDGAVGVSTVTTGRDAVVVRMADGIEVLVRSPGVPVRSPGIQAAVAAGVHVTTGTSLWFQRHQPNNVIGVTGTKGKSTTSALLAHLLAASGRDVALLGNIGAPLLAHPAPPGDHDVVVVELSSYQLADLQASIPIGVWLNLHHEHLDWHGSHDQYARDKGRIVDLSQTLVANRADPVVARASADHPDLHWVDVRQDPVRLGDVDIPATTLRDALAGSSLVGIHHLGNLAAALTAAGRMGVDPASLLAHVATFTPLPHRLELVHDDGRRWVDDSISTIPEAAIAALRAFPDVPVTLLAGGHDRSQDHAPLVEEITSRGDVLVVALPVTGTRLTTELAVAGGDVVPVESLEQAVEVARDRTPAGGVVLLSPAAPSYGQFRSFEERGDRFAALARGRADG